MERCNRTMMTKKEQREKIITLAKFQYNNHVHSLMHHLPFLLESRCLPHMGFELDQCPSRVESVNKFMEQMKSTLEEAKSSQKTTWQGTMIRDACWHCISKPWGFPTKLVVTCSLQSCSTAIVFL